MKVPVSLLPAVVACLLADIADGLLQASPVPTFVERQAQADELAERAKAAYEAAMKTVAASQDNQDNSPNTNSSTVDAAQASARKQTGNQSRLRNATVTGAHQQEDFEKLKRKEEKEQAQLLAAKERAEELEKELSSAQAALQAEKAAKKAMRDQKSMAASNAEMMMRDMHSTIADERAERLDAEKNASELSIKVRHLSEHDASLSSELKESKSLLQQNVDNATSLAKDLQKVQAEAEGLRGKLHLLQEESEHKAEELHTELKQAQDVAAKMSKKLNATKWYDMGIISKLKLQFAEKLKEKDVLRKSQKGKAFKLYNKTVGEVKHLNEENNRVKEAFVKHHKLMDQVRSRLRSANDRVKAEHRSMLEEKARADKAQKKADSVTAELHKMQSLFTKAKTIGKKYAVQALQLKKKIKKELPPLKAELAQVKDKLSMESNSLNGARMALKKTSMKLKRENEYKDNSRKRLRQLWEALETKRKQLESHDAQVAELQKQLREAENRETQLSKQLSNGYQLVKVDKLAKMDEMELKELHEHFVKVTQKEQELKDAHQMLADAQDKLQSKLDPEQHESLQGILNFKSKKTSSDVGKAKAAAGKSDRAQLSNMAHSQLDVSKKDLMDTQGKLAALNEQLAKDETKLLTLSPTLIQKAQLRGSIARYG